MRISVVGSEGLVVRGSVGERRVRPRALLALGVKAFYFYNRFLAIFAKIVVCVFAWLVTSVWICVCVRDCLQIILCWGE